MMSRGSLKRTDVAQLASVFDVSTGTIFNIIHDDLLQLPGAGNPVVLLLLAEELGDPAGGLLDEAEVVMDDVKMVPVETSKTEVS